MDKSISQTINLVVGSGGLANTGSTGMIAQIIAGICLILLSILFIYLTRHRGLYRLYRHHPSTLNHKLGHKLSHKLDHRFLVLLLPLLLATVFTVALSRVSADPTLALSAGQDNLTVSIPTGNNTVTANTTISASTANTTGYTLTASLAQPEPGIEISLSGGSVASPTPLGVGQAPLVLQTTSVASGPDTINITIYLKIDSSVKPGKKNLRLVYEAHDNTSTSQVLSMQTFTRQQCNNLTTYTGSNPEAIITLNDPRGSGTDYQVAKLADNNCWMLNNLRLGSISSTLTLTPTDTNISQNFTLPQLRNDSHSIDNSTDPGNDYDTPYTYGPIPGDTADKSSTDYGYLYNWSAVTAGETRTSHDETAGDAPYSICPANWRLPKGGYDTNTGNPSPTNEFNELSAKMAGFTNGQDVTYLNNYWDYYQAWQYNGPFKSTFSGFWGEGFGVQGGYGYLWSRSAFSINVDYADGASFNAGEVYPGYYAPRGFGLAVRCLLQ